MSMTLDLKPLGKRRGSLRYLGQCPICRRQHFGTHELVGPKYECEECYRKLHAEAKPTGRRRYDPEVKRCRADAIGYKTVTDPDGTTRTVKLSRGRFVSCEKQWRAEARPRGILGQFLPGPLAEREEVEVVVSAKWVAPEDRARFLRQIPFTQLIGRVPASPSVAPAPPSTPAHPRRPRRSQPAPPPPTVQPPPAVPARRGRRVEDEPTIPPSTPSRRPSTARTKARDKAQQVRQAAFRGEMPATTANDIIQGVNQRWRLGIAVVALGARRVRGDGRRASGRRDPMPARLEEWTALATGGWVWTSAEGPSFEVVPSPTLQGLWLLGWFDLPEWARAVVPRDVRREHTSAISAVREAHDLYSIFRRQPEYPR